MLAQAVGDGRREPREESGKENQRRGRRAQPSPPDQQHFGDGNLFGVDQVDGDAFGRSGLHRRRDRIGHVVEGSDLHLGLGMQDRDEPGERGQGAQQRADAEGGGGHDQTGPQDHPIDVEAGQGRLGGALGLTKGPWRDFKPSGGDVDDALDAGGLGRFAKAPQAIDMDGVRMVAVAVLQGAGAIDHRVDAVEDFAPNGRVWHGQIGLDPANLGETTLGFGDVTARAVNHVPMTRQARDNRAADQAVTADN